MDLEADTSGVVVMTIADDLCALQDAIRRGSLTDGTTIVASLRKIDEDLSSWADPKLDPEYTYDPAVDSSRDSDAVWQGVYHNYQNHFVCEWQRSFLSVHTC